MLDADEEISASLQNSIQEAINDEPRIYQVNRLSKAFGHEVKHSGWFPDWISRLYPNNLTTYNDALVHEALIIPKNYIFLLLIVSRIGIVVKWEPILVILL